MEKTPRIVAAGDDSSLQDISCALEQTGYYVLYAREANECLALVRANKPDLIVLSASLGCASGYAVCRVLRSQSDVPIIILTSHYGKMETELCLEVGATQCFPHSAHPREVVMCVKRLVKSAVKSAEAPPPPICVGDLVIYLDRLEVVMDGKSVHVSPLQLRLLRILAQHAGQIVDRKTLITTLWGEGVSTDRKYTRLSTAVARVRNKIEVDPFNPQRLVATMGPGGGYRLVC